MKQAKYKVRQFLDCRSGNSPLFNKTFVFDLWEVAIKILILKCVVEGEYKENEISIRKNEFHTCENCGLEYHLSI